MKYNHSDITQAVSLVRHIGKHIMELETGCNKGYEYTLSQPYMQEIMQYSVEGDKLRVILVADDVFSARQAYLCLINKFIRRMMVTDCNGGNNASAEEEEDDYIALYEDRDSTDIAVIEKVTVITDQYFKEIFDASAKEGNNISFSLKAQEAMESFPGDNLLFELCHTYNADAIIDNLLNQKKRCIAIMLRPKESYEYYIRRLTFEGEFDVLRVGRHSQKDYLECAHRYLEYHGFRLENEPELSGLLEKLQAYRGALFTETDVYTLLEKGMEKAFKRKSNIILAPDLALKGVMESKSAMEMLDDVVGLEGAKNAIKRLIALKKVIGNSAACYEAGNLIHNNMIFAGNPGTGKSKLARLYAKMLSAIGVSNGCFEDVSRADLVGKYVGHTAAKIKEVFERALGGVIFVDEASFLLGEDSFVKEAVVEFVRFMELYPETTVIFATYKEEAEQLLHVDAGFRSRVSKIVCFEDYGQEELYEIMNLLAKDYGVKLDENCRIAMEEYIDKIRGSAGFANGREVRKLLECSMEEYGLRDDSGKSEWILKEDVSNAAKFLLKQREIVPKRKNIGFLG